LAEVFHGIWFGVILFMEHFQNVLFTGDCRFHYFVWIWCFAFRLFHEILLFFFGWFIQLLWGQLFQFFLFWVLIFRVVAVIVISILTVVFEWVLLFYSLSFNCYCTYDSVVDEFDLYFFLDLSQDLFSLFLGIRCYHIESFFEDIISSYCDVFLEFLKLMLL